VKPYYIPLVTQNEDLDDYRPGISPDKYFYCSGSVCGIMGLVIDAVVSLFFSNSAEERQLRTKIKFKIRGSIRIRLFSGADLTHRRTTEPAAKAAAAVATSVQTSQTKSVRFAPIETASSGRAPPSTARHANVRQNTNYCVFPSSKSIFYALFSTFERKMRLYL
jgi:hypothetical protein